MITTQYSDHTKQINKVMRFGVASVTPKYLCFPLFSLFNTWNQAFDEDEAYKMEFNMYFADAMFCYWKFQHEIQNDAIAIFCYTIMIKVFIFQP